MRYLAAASWISLSIAALAFSACSSSSSGNGGTDAGKGGTLAKGGSGGTGATTSGGSGGTISGGGSGGFGATGGTGNTGGGGGAAGSGSSPYTCHKFCCQETDCLGGETCAPITQGQGTLGICVSLSDAGAGGSAGAGAGGSAGSGAGGAAGSGSTLPAGCFTGTANCNPFNNSGCTNAGEACDLLSDGTNEMLDCAQSGNTQALGQACDNAQGPWCQPSMTCHQPAQSN